MATTWRETFDTWEKSVAPGLEQMTASPGFHEMLIGWSKLSSAMAKETERASRRWLHAWNMPAATDVRSLRRQVASVDRELQALRLLMTELVEAGLVPASVLSKPAPDGQQHGPNLRVAK